MSVSLRHLRGPGPTGRGRGPTVASAPHGRHRVRLLRCPTVAMPAELNDGYGRAHPPDDWRVAVLRAGHSYLRRARHDGGRPDRRRPSSVTGSPASSWVRSSWWHLASISSTRTGRNPCRRTNPKPDLRRSTSRRRRPTVHPCPPALMGAANRPASATMLRRRPVLADHVVAAIARVHLVGLRRPPPCWSCRYGPRGRPVRGSSSPLPSPSILFAIGGQLACSRRGLPAAPIYLTSLLIGCGYAGQQVSPWRLLPDCIALRHRSGRPAPGGVLTEVCDGGRDSRSGPRDGHLRIGLQVLGLCMSSTRGRATRTDTPSGRAARLHARAGCLVGGLCFCSRAYREISR